MEEIMARQVQKITTERPLAVVTGVGDGTGASIVRRFHSGGYRVAMLARNRERLEALENELDAATAFVTDLQDLSQLQETMHTIRRELGATHAVIHNAVRATFGHYDDFDTQELEKNFTVSVSALHKMARFFVPEMLQRGQGTLIVTGNTAAHRGTPRYSMFAPAKAAQRIFTEALARRHGPDGIHVAYVTIDAPIKTSWTSEQTKNVPDDGFAMPDDIAEEVWHLAHQPRSTWSSDVWIRPFKEAF